MGLFLSTYLLKVDRKGRVSVPATFRNALSSQPDPAAIFVFPSFRFAALEGGGSDRIEEMSRRLEALDQFSDEHENLSLLFADTHRLPFDGEGRVILPDNLKEFAHIGDEAAFVGRGASFQIWDPRRFDEHRSATRDRSQRQGTTLPPEGARRP
ncbi:MAG: division/cell wall cluster transcriptional repressor MraZ [Alphaproteobacteria bacterium]|nr:division/cell wall cluster transcriptional repressor MraZ [Alphaproteobacteria bacterium]